MKPMLSSINQQSTMPITSSVLGWLLLRDLQANDVWWGVYFTVIGIWWILWVIYFIAIIVAKKKVATINEDGTIEVK